MKRMTFDEFNAALSVSFLKPRHKRDLRFQASVQDMTEQDWNETELLAIKDRGGNKGVLILDLDEGRYLLPYEINSLSPSSTTGRSSAIICDFCMTWQAGTRAGSIIFPSIKNDHSSNGFICCLDLNCSRHVRTKTSAAKISRAQLRENMDNDARIARLHEKLHKLIATLRIDPNKE